MSTEPATRPEPAKQGSAVAMAEHFDAIRAFVLAQPDPARAAGNAAGRLGLLTGWDYTWHISADDSDVVPWPLVDGPSSRRNWRARRRRRLRQEIAERQMDAVQLIEDERGNVPPDVDA